MARRVVNEEVSLKIHRWLHPKYWGLWLFFGLQRLSTLLPLRAIEAPGAFIGWLYYRLVSSRRRIARINIQQAFPQYSEAQIEKLNRAHFKNLGISIFEMGIAWWASNNYLRKHCRVEGLEHLEQALARGKGVILLTGHFSTLEMGGALMSLYTPLHSVYKRAHNPMFDTFMLHYRSKRLKKLIANTNVREFIKGLRDGYATWYAPDQDFTQHVVFAPFLGGMATTLISTAKVATMTGASVVPFYPQRLDKGRGYKLVILPALEEFPSGDQYQDAVKINQALEEMVRRNPEQYAWVHKRFKTQPPGMPPIY